MDWIDKVVIVTGGGTGIGQATCLQLAEQGAKVVINYSRSQLQAEETALQITQNGGQAITIQADVSRQHQVQDMITEVIHTYGRIDGLVNNASITRQLPFADLEQITDDIWDELYNINVKGMFYCAQAVAPWMKKAQQGSIINLGSIAGSTGYGSSLPYAVSKGAVHTLTKSLARALSPHIRVNCIIPGAVDTRWWIGNEDKMKRLTTQLLLERISTPADIASLICAILQQESMTGQLVTVDNGQTL
ncbi:3-oxoacyl-[acyl-carrier protein] reductase [Paenibacillus sp. SORGH_AS306]|uniref:SDR family NAD(P)-dependent oxidoreductase n=1 Tax=unclassified Paenibacillus TaxID=185978 RepID=UPI002781B763|nr:MULTISPECIES: SDR family oxidoreductase [unclassified Paenibacillus]MDQ1234385.1 3-oxoacyl-[acyl-carrier protein] reductase [Paenibacillus sp. SORGH_AS_0306]MDR6111431.1 3-oxoacyl-[acyl-carrier protein] reductase [Paenibacillus sp. SORGH_AS_0338]